MSFVIELGEVYKYAQNEPEVRRAHGLAKGDWEDVVNHLSQFFGQEVTDEQARKLLRIQPDNIVQFGADDRRDLLANHKVTDWGPLDPYALYQFLPQQNRVHQHTISVETHAPEGDSNATNPHNYSHLYLYVGDDGRPHMYGNYLCRPKGSKHPNGTQQMADMLDTAHQLGVSKVHMRAYSDLPNFVGSLVWPKMGFNDEIPEAAKNRLPDHLKTATDMHTLLNSTGGRKFWEDHVKAQPHQGAYDWSTLEHAVFDMDNPLSHDMLDEHKKLMYTKKQTPKPQTGTGNAPTTYSCRNRTLAGVFESQSHSVDRRGDGDGRGQSPAEGASGEVHTGDAFGQAFAEVLIRYSVEPTHADFHKAIHNEPEDMHHHLVYADWLQEQGMDKEADLIRKAATNGYAGVRSGIHTLNLKDAGQFADGGQYKGSVPTGRTTLHALFTRSAVDPDVALGWHAPVAPIEEWDAPEDYSSKDEVFRYSAVPANDIHPDYQHSGVAPRVGNALQQIAAQDSDAGLLAEGILRTGDHSVLKFLADKLDDDGHPLKDAFDWRHVERCINIDRALLGEISKHHTIDPHSGNGGLRPQSAGWTYSDWSSGTRGNLSQRRALNAVRKVVADASKTDLHHSVLRLLDNQFVSGMSNPNDHSNYDPAYIECVHPPEHRRHFHSGPYMQMLGSKPADPHMYPDTRPLNKRYQLEALKEKYNAYKGPAGGMVVKEFDSAVVGQWVQGGQFTKDLSKPTTQPTAKNKLTIEELIRKWRATLQKKQ